MKRMIAIALASGLIPLLAAGCNDRGDGIGTALLGPGAPAGGEVTVLIVGPRLVSAPGTYEWTALVQGAAGDVEYSWSLGDGAEEAVLSAGPILTLELDGGFVDELHITLVVRAGGREARATHVIAVCGGEQPIDWCTPLFIEEPDPDRGRAFARALVGS